MTLRLVLVSLVAALGFTVPGTPVIESWVASTQDWINARFVDWDTRKLPSAAEVISSDRNAMRLLARRPSRLSVAVITPEFHSRSVKDTPSLVEDVRTPRLQPIKLVLKSGASEALEIGEKPLTDIAFRLDPRNIQKTAVAREGLPTPRFSRVKFDAASALGQAARQWSASLNTWAASIPRLLPSFRPTVASRWSTEPGPRVKTSMAKLGAEPQSKTQELGIKLERAGLGRCHASDLESFGAMEQSEDLYFAADLPLVPEPPAVTPPASQVCMPALASATALCSISASAPAVVDDIYEEMTGCLHRFDDGFGRPVAKPAVEQQAPVVTPGTQNVALQSKEVAWIAPRGAIKPRFEPLEVGENRLTVIAFDLNRPIDGAKSAPVLADATVAPVPTVLPIPTTKAEGERMRPTPELSRAVRLTREAVYAWVNVLAGPAIVTVAQPNSNRIR